MTKHIAWGALCALFFVVGITVGKQNGGDKMAADIANDCRQAGSFAVNRSGFTCARVSK